MSKSPIDPRLCVLVIFLNLVGCGGGGGGASGPPPVSASFAVTPGTVTLSATSPNTATMTGPFVTGTVTGTVSGTLYINIDIAGPAVKSVGAFTIPAGSNSGTAQIVPQDPWGLGVGTFNSTITVHACQGDQTCKTGELNGSPQTVTVTYTVGSTLAGEGSTINPFEVASGTGGDLVLRSGGWGALTTPTSLLIGSTAALSFTHPDPTTFTLSYPALTSGTYSITTNNSDVLGSVNVVDVPVFAAAALVYPATAGSIADVLYDTDDHALIVTTRNADPATNQILSFSYTSGTWAAPVALTISGLRHVAPIVVNWQMPSYTLMSVSETQISYYNGGTLTPAAGTPINPTSSPFITTGAAFSNAGYYLLTVEDTSSASSVGISSFGGPGSGLPFALGLPSAATAGAFPQPTIASSADGSKIVVLASSGASAKIAAYDSTQELLSDTSAAFNHNGTGRIPALDRRAMRIVVSNDSATNVYDSAFNLLGTLPASTQAYVVNAAGTRVYTYDATPQILTFDVSASANGGAYTPVGGPIAVPAVGSSPRMAMTLDDQTVFVAGATLVIVQPVH